MTCRHSGFGLTYVIHVAMHMPKRGLPMDAAGYVYDVSKVCMKAVKSLNLFQRYETCVPLQVNQKTNGEYIHLERIPKALHEPTGP